MHHKKSRPGGKQSHAPDAPSPLRRFLESTLSTWCRRFCNERDTREWVRLVVHSWAAWDRSINHDQGVNSSVLNCRVLEETFHGTRKILSQREINGSSCGGSEIKIYIRRNLAFVAGPVRPVWSEPPPIDLNEWMNEKLHGNWQRGSDQITFRWYIMSHHSTVRSVCSLGGVDHHLRMSGQDSRLDRGRTQARQPIVIVGRFVMWRNQNTRQVNNEWWHRETS